MVNKEDWSAAMSSEVFREYAQNELKKEAMKPSSENEMEANFKFFKEIEGQINNSPKMKQAYKALQEKFASDEDYRMKTNPIFVNAVMMLELD